MAGHRYPLIAREGWPLIGAVALLAVTAVQVLNSIWLAMVSLALLVLLVLLFRDPTRKPPSRPDGIVSAVDGQVESVQPTDRGVIDREAVRIRIRVNPLGAYTARSPAAGQVLDLRENVRKGSRLRGVGGLWVQTDTDDDVVLLMHGPRFIGKPGAFVGYGERVGQGQRCAYLRLARHAEVYVPLNSRVLVKEGDYVRAGIDTLAKLVSK